MRDCADPAGIPLVYLRAGRDLYCPACALDSDARVHWVSSDQPESCTGCAGLMWPALAGYGIPDRSMLPLWVRFVRLYPTSPLVSTARQVTSTPHLPWGVLQDGIATSQGLLLMVRDPEGEAAREARWIRTLYQELRRAACWAPPLPVTVLPPKSASRVQDEPIMVVVHPPKGPIRVRAQQEVLSELDLLPYNTP